MQSVRFKIKSTNRKLYVEPLRESAKSKKPILTTGEISSMFGNISQLLFLAQELLFQLKETRTDTKKELSKVFAYYVYSISII